MHRAIPTETQPTNQPTGPANTADQTPNGSARSTSINSITSDADAVHAPPDNHYPANNSSEAPLIACLSVLSAGDAPSSEAAVTNELIEQPRPSANPNRGVDAPFDGCPGPDIIPSEAPLIEPDMSIKSVDGAPTPVSLIATNLRKQHAEIFGHVEPLVNDNSTSRGSAESAAAALLFPALKNIPADPKPLTAKPRARVGLLVPMSCADYDNCNNDFFGAGPDETRINRGTRQAVAIQTPIPYSNPRGVPNVTPEDRQLDEELDKMGYLSGLSLIPLPEGSEMESTPPADSFLDPTYDGKTPPDLGKIYKAKLKALGVDLCFSLDKYFTSETFVENITSVDVGNGIIIDLLSLPPRHHFRSSETECHAVKITLIDYMETVDISYHEALRAVLFGQPYVPRAMTATKCPLLDFLTSSSNMAVDKLAYTQSGFHLVADTTLGTGGIYAIHSAKDLEDMVRLVRNLVKTRELDERSRSLFLSIVERHCDYEETFGSRLPEELNLSYCKYSGVDHLFVYAIDEPSIRLCILGDRPFSRALRSTPHRDHERQLLKRAECAVVNRLLPYREDVMQSQPHCPGCDRAPTSDVQPPIPHWRIAELALAHAYSLAPNKPRALIQVTMPYPNHHTFIPGPIQDYVDGLLGWPFRPVTTKNPGCGVWCDPCLDQRNEQGAKLSEGPRAADGSATYGSMAADGTITPSTPQGQDPQAQAAVAWWGVHAMAQRFNLPPDTLAPPALLRVMPTPADDQPNPPDEQLLEQFRLATAAIRANFERDAELTRANFEREKRAIVERFEQEKSALEHQARVNAATLIGLETRLLEGPPPKRQAVSAPSAVENLLSGLWSMPRTLTQELVVAATGLIATWVGIHTRGTAPPVAPPLAPPGAPPSAPPSPPPSHPPSESEEESDDVEDADDQELVEADMEGSDAEPPDSNPSGWVSPPPGYVWDSDPPATTAEAPVHPLEHAQPAQRNAIVREIVCASNPTDYARSLGFTSQAMLLSCPATRDLAEFLLLDDDRAPVALFAGPPLEPPPVHTLINPYPYTEDESDSDSEDEGIPVTRPWSRIVASDAWHRLCVSVELGAQMLLLANAARERSGPPSQRDFRVARRRARRLAWRRIQVGYYPHIWPIHATHAARLSHWAMRPTGWRAQPLLHAAGTSEEHATNTYSYTVPPGPAPPPSLPPSAPGSGAPTPEPEDASDAEEDANGPEGGTDEPEPSPGVGPLNEAAVQAQASLPCGGGLRDESDESAGDAIELAALPSDPEPSPVDEPSVLQTVVPTPSLYHRRPLQCFTVAVVQSFVNSWWAQHGWWTLPSGQQIPEAPARASDLLELAPATITNTSGDLPADFIQFLASVAANEGITVDSRSLNSCTARASETDGSQPATSQRPPEQPDEADAQDPAPQLDQSNLGNDASESERGASEPAEASALDWDPLATLEFHRDDRRNLVVRLLKLYYLCALENVTTLRLPNNEQAFASNCQTNDAFLAKYPEQAPNGEYFRAYKGRVAVWIFLHCSSDAGAAAWRSARPYPVGSAALRRAYNSVVAALEALLQAERPNHPDERRLVAELTAATHDDFRTARVRGEWQLPEEFEPPWPPPGTLETIVHPGTIPAPEMPHANVSAFCRAPQRCAATAGSTEARRPYDKSSPPSGSAPDRRRRAPSNGPVPSRCPPSGSPPRSDRQSRKRAMAGTKPDAPHVPSGYCIPPLSDLTRAPLEYCPAPARSAGVLVVGYSVKFRQNAVPLVQNARTGLWMEPGGFFDQEMDKNYAHTAAREFMEEVVGQSHGFRPGQSSVEGQLMLENAHTSSRWFGPFGRPPHEPHKAYICISDGLETADVDSYVRHFVETRECKNIALVPLAGLRGDVHEVPVLGDFGCALQLRDRLGVNRVAALLKMQSDGSIPVITKSDVSIPLRILPNWTEGYVWKRWPPGLGHPVRNDLRRHLASLYENPELKRLYNLPQCVEVASPPADVPYVYTAERPAPQRSYTYLTGLEAQVAFWIEMHATLTQRAVAFRRDQRWFDVRPSASPEIRLPSLRDNYSCACHCLQYLLTMHGSPSGQTKLSVAQLSQALLPDFTESDRNAGAASSGAPQPPPSSPPPSAPPSPPGSPAGSRAPSPPPEPEPEPLRSLTPEPPDRFAASFLAEMMPEQLHLVNAIRKMIEATERHQPLSPTQRARLWGVLAAYSNVFALQPEDGEPTFPTPVWPRHAEWPTRAGRFLAHLHYQQERQRTSSAPPTTRRRGAETRARAAARGATGVSPRDFADSSLPPRRGAAPSSLAAPSPPCSPAGSRCSSPLPPDLLAHEPPLEPSDDEVMPAQAAPMLTEAFAAAIQRPEQEIINEYVHGLRQQLPRPAEEPPELAIGREDADDDIEEESNDVENADDVEVDEAVPAPVLHYLPSPDHPAREQLRHCLTVLYHLSSIEGVHHPPGGRDKRGKDKWMNPDRNTEYFRGHAGRCANWISTQAGAVHASLREAKPIQAGTSEIISSLRCTRSCLTKMLMLFAGDEPDPSIGNCLALLANEDGPAARELLQIEGFPYTQIPEHTAIAGLAVLLEHDFAVARHTARSPVLAVNEDIWVDVLVYREKDHAWVRSLRFNFTDDDAPWHLSQPFNYRKSTLQDVFKYLIEVQGDGDATSHYLRSAAGRPLTDLSLPLVVANKHRALSKVRSRGGLAFQLCQRAPMVTVTRRGDTSVTITYRRPSDSPPPSAPPSPPGSPAGSRAPSPPPAPAPTATVPSAPAPGDVSTEPPPTPVVLAPPIAAAISGAPADGSAPAPAPAPELTSEPSTSTPAPTAAPPLPAPAVTPDGGPLAPATSTPPATASVTPVSTSPLPETTPMPPPLTSPIGRAITNHVADYVPYTPTPVPTDAASPEVIEYVIQCVKLIQSLTQRGAALEATSEQAKTLYLAKIASLSTSAVTLKDELDRLQAELASSRQKAAADDSAFQTRYAELDQRLVARDDDYLRLFKEHGVLQASLHKAELRQQSAERERRSAEDALAVVTNDRDEVRARLDRLRAIRDPNRVQTLESELREATRKEATHASEGESLRARNQALEGELAQTKASAANALYQGEAREREAHDQIMMLVDEQTKLTAQLAHASNDVHSPTAPTTFPRMGPLMPFTGAPTGAPPPTRTQASAGAVQGLALAQNDTADGVSEPEWAAKQATYEKRIHELNALVDEYGELLRNKDVALDQAQSRVKELEAAQVEWLTREIAYLKRSPSETQAVRPTDDAPTPDDGRPSTEPRESSKSPHRPRRDRSKTPPRPSADMLVDLAAIASQSQRSDTESVIDLQFEQAAEEQAEKLASMSPQLLQQQFASSPAASLIAPILAQKLDASTGAMFTRAFWNKENILGWTKNDVRVVAGKAISSHQNKALKNLARLKVNSKALADDNGEKGADEWVKTRAALATAVRRSLHDGALWKEILADLDQTFADVPLILFVIREGQRDTSLKQCPPLHAEQIFNAIDKAYSARSPRHGSASQSAGYDRIQMREASQSLSALACDIVNSYVNKIGNEDVTDANVWDRSHDTENIISKFVYCIRNTSTKKSMHAHLLNIFYVELELNRVQVENSKGTRAELLDIRKIVEYKVEPAERAWVQSHAEQPSAATAGAVQPGPGGDQVPLASSRILPQRPNAYDKGGSKGDGGRKGGRGQGTFPTTQQPRAEATQWPRAEATQWPRAETTQWPSAAATGVTPSNRPPTPAPARDMTSPTTRQVDTPTACTLTDGRNWTNDMFRNAWIDMAKIEHLASSRVGHALCKFRPSSSARTSTNVTVPKANEDGSWHNEACAYCYFRPRAPANMQPSNPNHWWYGTGNGAHNPRRCLAAKCWLAHGGDSENPERADADLIKGLLRLKEGHA